MLFLHAMEVQNTDKIVTNKSNSSIKKFLVILLLIILLLGLIASVYLVGRRVFFSSSASELGYGTPDSGNSYIFASPLKAGAGGEKIRVTVFVLDGSGKGVLGKTVQLSENAPLTVSQVQPVTDQTGKAVFDISSKSTGLFFVEASFDGEIIPQRVQLRFE